MTTEQIVGLIVANLIMGLGLLGCIIPLVPSTSLIFLAALGHRLYFGSSGASNLVMGILLGFLLLSLVVDQLASMYGAKKLGATWKGVLGAGIGGVVGMFLGLPGLILGPFIGSMGLEAASGRTLGESAKAGLGATIGLLFGVAGKAACSVAMIGLFTVNVILRSRGSEGLLA